MKSVYLVSQRLMLATSMLLLLTLSAVAQAPTPAAPAAPKLDSGDTAWMPTSVALVLMMTVPGLALFYGGMVRKMNVLATVCRALR
jgi:Amt family ammonium transporter